MNLTGPLPLTAAEHEFATTEEAPGPQSSDEVDWLCSDGWTLIGCDTCTEQDPIDYERICTGHYYHWARRKDGRPLVLPKDDSRIQELEQAPTFTPELREALSDLLGVVNEVLKKAYEAHPLYERLRATHQAVDTLLENV